MCYTPASITATVLGGAPSQAADSASTAVGVLRRGEPFTASVADGTWRHVTTASGVTGWVDDGDLRPDDGLRPN